MVEHPAPTPGVVEEDLDGEVCLYRSDVDEVLILNETAADVWRLCDGEQSTTRIIGLLAMAYGATPDELAADVRATLDRLHSDGYLVESGTSTRREC